MQNRLVVISGAALGGCLATGLGSIRRVKAEEKVTPPKYPWDHLGLFSSYDHAR